MKTFFYPRLAWDGLRKNKRMVFPYILTCICMICMFYILVFLSSPKTTELLPRGRDMTQMVMTLGCVVIAVFSLIFLYYTNSFLIRRRAAEFGLYNVLGMNKGNLCKIVTFESAITSGIALILGLVAGIILSKLAELGLVKLVGGTVTYSLRVDARCAVITVLFYLAIFALIWISSVIRVGRSSAVSLLKSEKAGEKAPKANWFLGLLGALILGTAYYIAVSIGNPIEAILWFFTAVIMVIIATYLLLIAGSVLLCRILQKNRNYYYKPAHFVSVSSMVYRMKRNGAGLASIAIIATMVLVMISSVTCMWFGTKDMLDTRFPGDIDYTIRFYNGSLLTDENRDNIRKIIADYGQEHDLKMETALDVCFAETTGYGEENRVYLGSESADVSSVTKLRDIFLISVSEYRRMTGSEITLNEGEAVAFATNCKLGNDTIELITEDRTLSLELVKADEKKMKIGDYREELVPTIKLIVPDVYAVASALGISTEDMFSPLTFTWRYCFNVENYQGSMMDCANTIRKEVEGIADTQPEMAANFVVISEERETEGAEYTSANGSMFFIGIVLSAVFILAAVLIIYYKQISEGYEDSKRFEVMRKVGMTGKEIKKSINSQLLAVFFLPLIFAGLHLAFAYPMIAKLLMLFGIYNKGLFMTTTLISFAVFAAFYIVIYKVTSNTYYNIVSEAKNA